MLVQSNPWISAWMGKSLGLMMGSQKVRLPEIGIQVYPTFATDGHGAGWLSIVFFFSKSPKKTTRWCVCQFASINGFFSLGGLMVIYT